MKNEWNPTRRSLLSRLRSWEDQESWREFFEIYRKLIYATARRAGLSCADAEDVVQETVLEAAKQLPGFRYDPGKGSFKGWLRNTTRWKISAHLRKNRRAQGGANRDVQGMGSQHPIPDEPVCGESEHPLDCIWEMEWRRCLADAALQMVRSKTRPEHFRVYHLRTLKDLPAAEVARILRLRVASVHLINHRVGKRVRQELDRLQREGEPPMVPRADWFRRWAQMNLEPRI